jgi:putative transposase
MARVVVPGVAHHVTHRGNLRGDVFLFPDSRQFYLGLLGECAKEAGMDVWAWCLMANHVHLIVVPHDADSLRRGVGLADQRYAAAVNARKGWTGHLWANRFYSTVLDEGHLWHAVKYVELNPVRAGLVKRAEDYPWSSARAHAGIAGPDPLLASDSPFPGPVADWAAWLAEGLDEESCAQLRRATYTGRPCASPRFTAHLETRLGRTLLPQKRGRKPKSGPPARGAGRPEPKKPAGKRRAK